MDSFTLTTRPIPLQIRRKVFAKYGNRCTKCRCPHWLEIHHIKALVYGGTHDIDNLILLCHECHREAPDDRKEFDEYMKTGYDPKISAYVAGIKIGWKLIKEGTVHIETFDYLTVDEIFDGILGKILKDQLDYVWSHRDEVIKRLKNESRNRC